jgi:cellulose biosynthesis protein BcsQ
VAVRQRNELPSAAGSAGDRPFRVLTVASGKGGVGKTTIACNLAVYLRALREDLPILALTLDDQPMVDRMFGIGSGPVGETLIHGLHRGNLRDTIQAGEYGVHYIPSSPEASELKHEFRDPLQLMQVLEATGWHGLVIIDTKSDLEILTQSGLAASDLALVVVSDHASLTLADKVFELSDAMGRERRQARVLLSLVDRRIRYSQGEDRDILALLLKEVRRRRYPLLQSFVSRSPAIEALYTNPEGRAYTILHRSPRSLVHQQMHHVAEEVLEALQELGLEAGDAPASVSKKPPAIGTARIPSAAAEPSGHAYRGEVAAFRRADPPILALQARELSLESLQVEPAPGLGGGERVHLGFPQQPGEAPLLVWARVVPGNPSDPRVLSFEGLTEADRLRLGYLLEGPGPDGPA